MIDTHSHIYGPEFDDDRADAVARAKDAGVEYILLPNVDKTTIEPMLALCREYPGYCYPMMGLHPTEVNTEYQSVLDEMHALLVAPDNPYIAVGEVGLDFYWDDTFRKQQLDAFEQQIEWARDLYLPLVIHTRSAHPDLLDAMNRHKSEGLTGIFHCFSGSIEAARELLRYDGFVLGIGGVLTYKNAHLPEVVRQLPIDRIVLETDAPYLSPVPHRGKRNESAYVADTMMRLAQELGMTPEQVDEVTTSTAKRIFANL